MAKRRQLPSSDQVWAAVCEFAQRCKRDRTKRLYTLAKFVPNSIVDVTESRITRHSDEGRSQTAHINRSHVEGVWTELATKHFATTKGHPRVFTHALMLHALPQFIEQVNSNTIRLITGQNDPLPPLPSFAQDQRSFDPRPGRALGGEGPKHRALRLYIFEEPDRALYGLHGGPWNICATERTLETQDRIDVVLRDNDGNFTLIEVKPQLVSDLDYPKLGAALPYAIAPFAQAAKYRSQWHVLYGTPLERIRCVVAAPEVPRKTLARQMRRKHGVESVAVTLPAERIPN